MSDREVISSFIHKLKVECKQYNVNILSLTRNDNAITLLVTNTEESKKY